MRFVKQPRINCFANGMPYLIKMTLARWKVFNWDTKTKTLSEVDVAQYLKKDNIIQNNQGVAGLILPMKRARI